MGVARVRQVEAVKATTEFQDLWANGGTSDPGEADHYITGMLDAVRGTNSAIRVGVSIEELAALIDAVEAGRDVLLREGGGQAVYDLAMQVLQPLAAEHAEALDALT